MRQGESRDQGSLFPISLEELIPENPTLEKLQAKHSNNLTCQALMAALEIEQFVPTESEARMMHASQEMSVGYNVQTAVDDKHCLILHHEVTQDSNDIKQLEPMAKAAQAALEQDNLTVVADAGGSCFANSAAPRRK